MVKIPRARVDPPPTRRVGCILHDARQKQIREILVQNTLDLPVEGRSILRLAAWLGQPLHQQRLQLWILVAGKVEATSRPVKGRLPQFVVVRAHPLNARSYR